MSDMPDDNAGTVNGAIVSSKGLKQNGNPTTGPEPEAYVTARVRAGEVPHASAIPSHDTPDNVSLGPVHDYAEWEGPASATLTRSYWYESQNKVVDEPDKNRSEDLYLKVVRKDSTWKSVKTGLAAGAALSAALELKYGNKTPTPFYGRLVVYVSITVGFGTVASFKKEIYNEVDKVVGLELDHDPVPGYRVRKGRLFKRWVTVPHQIIDSTAEVSGDWTISDPDTFGDTSKGDSRIFRHSHSHWTGLGYGQLHTGTDDFGRRGHLPFMIPPEELFFERL